MTDPDLGDRRRTRSKQILIAIHLQLEAVAKRIGAVAVFVADTDGLLLGASEADIDYEALAAYSSLPWKLGQSPYVQMQMTALMREFEGYHVHLRKFPLEGTDFQLGIVTEGPMSEEDQVQATTAIGGVLRILAEHARD